MHVTKNVFLAMIISAALIAGCAHFSADMESLTATNITDLEKARANGLSKDFASPIDKTFSAVTALLNKEELKIFLADKKKGFIVALGFPRQTNTTRVGIFFESLPSGGTKITLSSLSSSALDRAGAMIFGGLSV